MTRNNKVGNCRCPPDPPSEGSTCLICLEDSPTITLLQLVHMFDEMRSIHCFCRSCLEAYLIQCENDRKTAPMCPHPDCHIVLETLLISDILSRPYQPKVWYTPVDEDEKKSEDFVDNEYDAFMVWANENDAMQCKNCHAFIVRDEGCEAMQCLCGWRFCWSCRSPIQCSTSRNDNGICSCGHNVQDFYDNIRRRENLDAAPQLATIEDLQNMKDYYNQRGDSDIDSYFTHDPGEIEVYAMDDQSNDEGGIDNADVIEEPAH